MGLQFRLYRGGSGTPLERVPLSKKALDKVELPSHLYRSASCNACEWLRRTFN